MVRKENSSIPIDLCSVRDRLKAYQRTKTTEVDCKVNNDGAQRGTRQKSRPLEVSESSKKIDREAYSLDITMRDLCWARSMFGKNNSKTLKGMVLV